MTMAGYPDKPYNQGVREDANREDTMDIGNTIKIIANIDGDDTPIGTTGTITAILRDGTVLITLSDGAQYWTSIDGTDYEVVN